MYDNDKPHPAVSPTPTKEPAHLPLESTLNPEWKDQKEQKNKIDLTSVIHPDHHVIITKTKSEMGEVNLPGHRWTNTFESA